MKNSQKFINTIIMNLNKSQIIESTTKITMKLSNKTINSMNINKNHNNTNNNNHNNFNFDLSLIFAFLIMQIISWIFIFDLDEYSPLVLFSWWRNKIS